MRTSLRLLASVKPGRFLEPGNPTGLTGLFTHPTPRSTLIYLYNSTLEKLKAFPEHSVYRKSTESLTTHRLKIVESFTPPGYDEWLAKAKKQVEEHPEIFNTREGSRDIHGGSTLKSVANGKTFITTRYGEEYDELDTEWDGEKGTPELEGPRLADEKRTLKNLTTGAPRSGGGSVEWVVEPPLEASQIADMENQLEAGLIEEVIQVAEGELQLVDVMAENKVWEDLTEKPQEGQWEYFSRVQHTQDTEAPPTGAK